MMPLTHMALRDNIVITDRRKECSMVKHLRKVGNSSAVTIDKALMELVGLDERGAVRITVTNGSILLTPVSPRTIDPAKFDAALDRVVFERRKVLRHLAN